MASIAHRHRNYVVSEAEIEQELSELAELLREQSTDGTIPLLSAVCPRCGGYMARMDSSMTVLDRYERRLEIHPECLDSTDDALEYTAHATKVREEQGGWSWYDGDGEK